MSELVLDEARAGDPEATAACHGVDYLLTWNAAHIANAEYRPRVERTCRAHGYEPPVLCTPNELMGEEPAP